MNAEATKFAKKRVKHPYYNFDKVFSYNAVFNFVVGGRGLGKTYGAKKKAITNALRKDEQFIYLRRYKPELVARNTFFDDLIANDEFPEWDFRVNGNRAEASGVEFRDEKKRQWKTLGYFIALSTAQSQKSVAFPHVTLIIFDEFIIEKGMVHYMPDEANVFNNFYNTVDRNQDKTRVLFLANSVSIANPYFLMYNIEPDDETEWLKQADGFMVCHFAKSEDFASSVQKTRFGRFIHENVPEYEEYAVGNKFADNNDHLLQFKDEKARYQYTLHTPRGAYSIWYNGISARFYAQRTLPKQERHFVTDVSLMRDGRLLLLRSDKLMQMLRTAFRKGVLTFDSPQTRNGLLPIFK